MPLLQSQTHRGLPVSSYSAWEWIERKFILFKAQLRRTAMRGLLCAVIFLHSLNGYGLHQCYKRVRYIEPPNSAFLRNEHTATLTTTQLFSKQTYCAFSFTSALLQWLVLLVSHDGSTRAFEFSKTEGFFFFAHAVVAFTCLPDLHTLRVLCN